MSCLFHAIAGRKARSGREINGSCGGIPARLPGRTKPEKEGLSIVINNSWQKRAVLKGSVASAAVTIAMLAGSSAFAQSTASTEAAEAETIVVTGSLIKNPNLERATPVSVTSASEIELRGVNSAEAVLREIPGVVPSIGSAVNNGNGGASFVNLRGLGSNRNIVLLDGDRLTPAELNGRFDLNNIPTALLERVDVLTGGASTTYGADAISGVVNFITKRDFSGVELSGNTGITQKGDGGNIRLDLTIGTNLDDGRGNVVLSFGYMKTDPVYMGDRDFSVTAIDSFTGQGGGSGTGTPSRFTGVSDTGADSVTSGCGGTTGVTCVTSAQGTRQIAVPGYRFSNVSLYAPYNYNPYNVFQTPFKRYNMYAAGRYEINDAVEVYARGLFSRNSVKTIIAPSGSFGYSFTVPLNNPFMSAAQRQAFCQYDVNPGVGYTPRFTAAECAAAATAVDPNDPNYRSVTSTISRRATEFGPRISDFVTTYFDYQAGLRGGITENIDWDASVSYGESENTQTQYGYWLRSRLQQGLLAGPNGCFNTANNCVPVNLFGPDGSITSEMNQFMTGNSVVSTRTSMLQAKGLISGDVGYTVPWASDGISFAIGTEYRKYNASQESDLLSQANDLGGAGGAAPNVAGAYSVYEGIGEVLIPLVQDVPGIQSLTVGGGIRYSSYKVEAAGSPSYDAWTWKGEATWNIADGFKVRGNYSRAVRAPNISELFYPVTTALTNLGTDPCAGANPVANANLRAVCIAQGATAGQIGTIAPPSAGQVNYTGGGNLNLKPEKSNSWTVGLVATPTFLPGFSATIDYYNIKVTDAITSPTPGDAIAACFGNLTAASASDPACTSIRRYTDGSLNGDAKGLLLTLSNMGRLATDGIDLTMNYATDLSDSVRLSLGFQGNWTHKSTFQATPTSVDRDCVGYYSVNCGSIQPKYSFSQRTTLSVSDLDFSLNWRFLSSTQYEPLQYDDELAAAIRDGCRDPQGADPDGCMVEKDFLKIPAAHYFDFSLRANIIENFTLTVSALNLFDKKPHVVGANIGSTSYNSGNNYPSTYDALGRRFSVTGRLRF